MATGVDRGAVPSRRGTETRRRTREVALELFTRQGYEATSLREIADVLGINKASLYYHFASKEAILQSLVDERGTEAADLLAWLRAQPRGPELLERTVLRWVDTFSAEKLAGIRFTTANPLVVRGLAGSDGIGATLEAIADELVALVPESDDRARHDQEVVIVRMAITSINAAVQAAAGVDVPDAAVVVAARRAAQALVREVQGGAR